MPLRVERDSVIGPVRIAFSFASHARVTQRPSSHDTTLLVLKPCDRAFRGLVSSVSGSQPKGRGFESRLQFFKFFLKASE
ncbi:MAG: hypothetical protein PV344_09070 [Anaplasma sp.]|nr:hypothetical protein [Anaplasma sp.]